MQETWVQSLGWEHPQEKEKLPTTEFHGLYSSWGCKESDMTEQLSLSTIFVDFFGHYFFKIFCTLFSLFSHYACVRLFNTFL